jgi:multiple sugar transport system permease protein
MIEGARWRKWVFFYAPMALFLLFLLFPFYWMVITSVRPDGELYRPWNAINYNPFWTWKPTLDHVRYLFEETLFASWLWNTTFIALASTAISLVCVVDSDLSDFSHSVLYLAHDGLLQGSAQGARGMRAH